jgi:hypothetical protein
MLVSMSYLFYGFDIKKHTFQGFQCFAKFDCMNYFKHFSCAQFSDFLYASSHSINLPLSKNGLRNSIGHLI